MGYQLNARYMRLHHCDRLSLGGRRIGWWFSCRVNKQQPKSIWSDRNVARHPLPRGKLTLSPVVALRLRNLPAPNKLVLSRRAGQPLLRSAIAMAASATSQSKPGLTGRLGARFRK
jgi:hypothetical protein